MQRIVTLTMNPALDMSTSVDLVVPEHKLRCKSPAYEPGGGGINVSRAIHKLGGTSTACYLAGGHTGDLFQQLLREEGLDQQIVPIRGQTRESITVLEEASTQQYRFNMPGPAVHQDECEQMLATLDALDPPPTYLVISGSSPPGVPETIYHQLADLADRMGARLVVDTSGPPLRAALERGVYLIKPNMRELGLLEGRRLESDADLEAVCRRRIAEGQAKAIVVSLGAGGAILVTAEETIRYRAPTVPIQSKVGAGDSMVGGIVLALARGEPLVEAARFGVAAGAAAVMTPGTELCRREDTERLYTQMKESKELVE